MASQEIPTQQKGEVSGSQNPGTGLSQGDGSEEAKLNTAETSDTRAKENLPEVEPDARPAEPPARFTATAYSLRGRTASGKPVRRGLIAADRRVLPIGTRVRLDAGPYSGEYVVADTGGAVRGRKIDIWVPSTGEAVRFGRRSVKLTVLTRVRPRPAARKRAR
ncbi:MAG TPA: 3D domain-containing protein [Pyrinomonadaceae bacterium]|nr:3D domain-containing protein [Pyrinomonadaceae bacterium]